MTPIIKATIWKEFMYFKKQTIMLVFFYYAMITYVFVDTFNRLNILRMLNEDTILRYLFAFILIIIISCNILTVALSFNCDMQEGARYPVLASVKFASDIWIGQLIFSLLLSMAVSLFGIILILFILCKDILLLYHINIINALLWIILSLSIGIAFTAIFLFLTWVIKHQGFILAGTFILLGMGVALVFQLSNTMTTLSIDITIISILSLIVCFLIIFLLKHLIDRLSKERYVGKI